MKRCDWATSSEIEAEYHDEVWGVPVHDDRLLFEMLILEGAQAGLSWKTILQKRAGYIKAFDNFDIKKVSKYTDSKKNKLHLNPEIIRNKLKISATVENAKRCLEIQEEYDSFDQYIWSFVNGQPIINSWKKQSDVPSTSPESEAMSKSLKEKGFKFVGPTICYAYMQAIGMVNDHLESCYRHKQIKNTTLK